MMRILVLVLGLSALLLAPGRAAEPPPMPSASAEALRAVVALRVTVPTEARSAATLGRERTGNGVVIDSAGLIVTIGYLILEASSIEVTADGKKVPASVVGYDHESGLGWCARPSRSASSRCRSACRVAPPSARPRSRPRMAASRRRSRS
ncbi:MAG: S1C family serine protease [Pseudomonadota bacterium]